MRRVAMAAALALSIRVVAAADARQPADLIVTGGRIHTQVRDGRFVFVGSAREAALFRSAAGGSAC